MQNRFENFKKFVEEQVPHSPVVWLLRPMNLDAFAAIMIKMMSEHPPCGCDSAKICADHVMDAILKALDLDHLSFTPAALAKFKLYVEYFMETICAGINSTQ